MADFDFPIHRFSPQAPKYNVVFTDMEGMKEKRRLKSTAPRRQWTIEIRGRTNDERDAILSHYAGQGGPAIPFNWIVTDYYGGDTFYVRYEDLKYENPPGIGCVWDFEITFIEVLV